MLLITLVFAIGLAMPVFADSEASDGLKIDKAGTYTLTGSMQGSVIVDPGEGEVTLILDDVSIDSAGAPAIQAISGDALHIELAACSCNRIRDGGDNTLKAALYTKVNTDFSGRGCLGITGTCGHGVIAEGADISFSSGEYLICSRDSGIKADTLNLNGGKIFINTEAGDLVQAGKVNGNEGLLQSSDATDVCSICTCCKGTGCAKTQKTCTGCTDDDEDEDECEGCCSPSTDKPGYIAEGTTSNSAGDLIPDLANAVDIIFSAANPNAVIDREGTYILSGNAGEGSLTVKKGTKGVVLVLRDLNLTSSSGSAIRINDNAEVQIVVDGKVVLKEKSPAGKKGAAIKAGRGTAVYVTGTGSMKISSVYDGIAMGLDSSLVIDGKQQIDIAAGHDGISSGSDIAVLDGTLTIDADNVGIHSDGILTVGESGGDGPDLTVSSSTEGLEADVVNIKGGKLDITASEDGIDAEASGNSDAPEPSVNISGGDIRINAGANGIDSDGNVNIQGGDISIDSCEENACIDYDGELYINKDVSIDCGCGCGCSSECDG